MKWRKASEPPSINYDDKWDELNRISIRVVIKNSENNHKYFGRYYYSTGRWQMEGWTGFDQSIITEWLDESSSEEEAIGVLEKVNKAIDSSNMKGTILHEEIKSVIKKYKQKQ